MTTMTRPDEIKAIHKEYKWFYPFTAGIVILIIGFMLGAVWFKGTDDGLGYLTNLYTEVISIGVTLVILDRINEYRETQRLKRRLVREAGSTSNETAKSAVDWLRHEGWLNGEKGLLKSNKLPNAKLQGANLSDANLSNSELVEATFANANLVGANLESSNLIDTNFTGANLIGANLSGVNLQGANLKNAVLHYDVFEADLHKVSFKGSRLGNLYSRITSLATIERAQIEHAKALEIEHSKLLEKEDIYSTKRGFRSIQKRVIDYYKSLSIYADLKGSVLPDGTKWTEDIDMTRFTDSNHPDFWQPPEEK